MTAAKDIEPDIVDRLRASESADPLIGEAILAIEALRAELAHMERAFDGLTAGSVRLMAERDAARELLRRIRQWDHLDGAADGPYWKQEIDAALGAQSLCVGCQQPYFCAKRGCISRAFAAKERT